MQLIELRDWHEYPDETGLFASNPVKAELDVQQSRVRLKIVTPDGKDFAWVTVELHNGTLTAWVRDSKSTRNGDPSEQVILGQVYEMED